MPRIWTNSSAADGCLDGNSARRMVIVWGYAWLVPGRKMPGTARKSSPQSPEAARIIGQEGRGSAAGLDPEGYQPPSAPDDGQAVTAPSGLSAPPWRAAAG